MVSQTDRAARRRGWDVRAGSATRRLMLYNNVEMAIAFEQNQGGKPLEMVWKRPEAEIRHLLKTGGGVLRAYRRTSPADVAHEQIERLEDVLTQLAAADDWTRRLREFWQGLRTERARLALTKLVGLGCVPHDLVRCVRNWTDHREADAIEGKRRETRIYRPKLQRLAASFQRLATQCDSYNTLPEHYGGTTCRLDRHIAAFLREEAAVMREFIQDADPRRHAMFTMANAHLMDMMRDIKTITGGFQDRLVTDFLNGVPGIRVSTDQLRKLRGRYASRGKAWTSPRYLGRPVSRIDMDPRAPHR